MPELTLTEDHERHSSRMLRTAEVADRLGYCIPAVRRLVQQGKLPCVRIGARGPWLYPADEIEALLTPQPKREAA